MPNEVGYEHLFVACQAGAEGPLKRELAREQPGMRFGFSRPGFVTFRRAEGAPLITPEFEQRLVFARAFGACLGRAADASAVLEHARELARAEGKPLRLHVFERERFAPGEEPKGFAGGDWAAAWKEEIAARAAEDTVRIGEGARRAGEGALFLPGELAEDRELVLDVIVIEEREAWLGLHRHSGAHSPFPGGNPGLALPAEAPSRAWFKIEEALRWPGAPMRAGDVAIELGAAPGGAAYALLARGLRVYGIDSAEMAPGVREHAAFTWIRGTAQEALEGGRLPPTAEWLLLDIHARGEIALRELAPYAQRYQRAGLLGMLLTLKLGSWAQAGLLPRWLEKVRELGMVHVRATQLPGNRQEIAVVALTPRGTTTR